MTNPKTIAARIAAELFVRASPVDAEAQRLIKRSRDTGQAAVTQWDAELHDSLRNVCDDYADTDAGYDYWQLDEDGGLAWRVSLHGWEA